MRSLPMVRGRGRPAQDILRCIKHHAGVLFRRKRKEYGSQAEESQSRSSIPSTEIVRMEQLLCSTRMGLRTVGPDKNVSRYYSCDQRIPGSQADSTRFVEHPTHELERGAHQLGPGRSGEPGLDTLLPMHGIDAQID